MSRAARNTLIGTILACAATVAVVHISQQSEREAMHGGVIRDEERTRIKRERQEDFDLQALLKEQYLKGGQTVQETSAKGDHREGLEK